MNTPQRPPWGQKKVTVVERFKEDSMYGLSARNVAVVDRWPLVEVRLCTKGYFFLSKMVWLNLGAESSRVKHYSVTNLPQPPSNRHILVSQINSLFSHSNVFLITYFLVTSIFLGAPNVNFRKISVRKTI